MGKTFAEKALGRAAGYDVVANQVVTVEPDWCMSHDNGLRSQEHSRKLALRTYGSPSA